MTIKHIYCIIAACVLAALVTGCVQPVADLYSDFLLNEDVLMRFEICYADVKKGRAGAFTAGELKALQQDMQKGYGTGDAEADRATELFEKAAGLLAEAIEEDEPYADEKLKEARSCFDEGWRVSLRVREGAYDG